MPIMLSLRLGNTAKDWQFNVASGLKKRSIKEEDFRLAGLPAVILGSSGTHLAVILRSKGHFSFKTNMLGLDEGQMGAR